MASNVELLPLPEDFNFMQWEAHMQDYARACVEANTEALRAEVERLEIVNRLEKGVAEHAVDAARAAEARIERLAEALRIVKDNLEFVAKVRGGHGTFTSTYLIVTAALNPTAAQENGRD